MSINKVSSVLWGSLSKVGTLLKANVKKIATVGSVQRYSATFVPTVISDCGFGSSTSGNGDPSVTLSSSPIGDPGSPFPANGVLWFCLFKNVTIPKNATIVSAVVKLTTDQWDGNGGLNLKITLENVDNAPNAGGITWSSLSSRWGNGTSYIDWDTATAWLKNTLYTSPSIINALQTLVQRTGWVSGNSALVMINNDNSASNKYAYVLGWADGRTNVPKLEVTWDA